MQVVRTWLPVVVLLAGVVALVRGQLPVGLLLVSAMVPVVLVRFAQRWQERNAFEEQPDPTRTLRLLTMLRGGSSGGGGAGS